MDRTGSPGYTWLLCLMYVYFILNFTICAALNGQVPMTHLTGSTQDISPLLYFHWWEKSMILTFPPTPAKAAADWLVSHRTLDMP